MEIRKLSLKVLSAYFIEPIHFHQARTSVCMHWEKHHQNSITFKKENIYI